MVLLGADAPGGSGTSIAASSSPPASQGVGGRRYNRTSASAPSSSSQPPDPESKQDNVDGPHAGLSFTTQQHFVRLADGAARASVVSTELTNSPVVDLVAGVLDAKETGAREVGLLEVVKTKINKNTFTDMPDRLADSNQQGGPPKQLVTGGSS